MLHHAFVHQTEAQTSPQVGVEEVGDVVALPEPRLPRDGRDQVLLDRDGQPEAVAQQLAERMAALRDPAVKARLIAEETPDPMLRARLNTWDMIFKLGDPPDYEPLPETSLGADMGPAIDETNRRRAKQVAYNTERGIDPQPLRKKIADITDVLAREASDTQELLGGRATAKNKSGKGKSPTPQLRREGIAAEGAMQLEATIEDLTAQMLAAASELKFELAGRLRDEVQDLKKELRAMERAGHA